MGLFSLAFAFFLLMDSIGNVPIFIALLKGIPKKRQYFIITRELLIALGIIIAFVFFGEAILNLLNISSQAIQIAGGIILFIISMKMIFPKPKDEKIAKGGEPFLVPMAIPLVAGPAILAAVMIYSKQEANDWILIGAVVVAWLATMLVLLLAPKLKQLLGNKGLAACERLMGLILILIATEMFIAGFKSCLT